MINCRRLIGTAATSLLIASPATHAQTVRKVYRVGILGNFLTAEATGPQPRSPYTNAFLRGMRELGYVYGEHFVTEPRGSAGKPERFPVLAAEMMGLQLDVIVAAGQALAALKQATSTMPIVMTASNDPVGQGYVQSLARPGGNMTGLSLQATETTGKRLELLKQFVPGAAPVAVLWDREQLPKWQAAEAAARGSGWKLLSIEVRHAADIEAAFRVATEARAGAALVTPGGTLFPQARRVADLAAQHRLPAMYELRPMVEAGGLISYGADIVDIWRRAAVYVDKILRGAKPADLPVEQPTKFELVINLKAAKALGLTIPPSLMLRADEVIE
jgi:putative tryptophan/tyrosine transport system substrate-binding protein